MIELLMVFAIIGILATLSLTVLSSARAKSRDAKRGEDMRQFELALALFYADHGHYPSVSAEGIDSKGEMLGDNAGPIELALGPYMNGPIPKDPRHDGSVYFYSYDPVHCLLSNKPKSCVCLVGSTKTGATIAFNKAFNPSAP